MTLELQVSAALEGRALGIGGVCGSGCHWVMSVLGVGDVSVLGVTW